MIVREVCLSGEVESDKSNGYDAIAADYMKARGSSEVGARPVREWAATLPEGASVLELGCGHGAMTKVLLDVGLSVHAVDASKAMLTALLERFPGLPVECAAVEESQFFGQTFDGVLAWGFMFLLTPETQKAVIAKVGAALRTGGTFLFTSPKQECVWQDAMTRLPTTSIGYAGYQRTLAAAGLALVGELTDEGQNYYYWARKL